MTGSVRMKKCHLEGMRFGMLTVEKELAEKKDRYVMWHCKCDCGGSIDVNTRQLKRGTVTNCGCISKTTAHNGNRAEDLTNRKFGALTALYRIQSVNNRTRWVCRCDCGKLHTVSAGDLKSGRIKSCGCQQYQRKHQIRDITDQKFGRLKALYPLEKRDRKGSVIWHCRCDCGNEVDISVNCLVHGNYKSCGCLKKEIQGNIPEQLHKVDGTCLEWLRNRKYRKDNKSGFRGVYETPNHTYKVSIGFKKKRYHVGTYKTYEEAVKHRLEVEEKIHEGFVKAYYEWKEKCDQDPGWEKTHPLIFEVEKNGGELVVKVQK